MNEAGIRNFVAGRLEGLAGTDRYAVEEAMRLELKELASLLTNADQWSTAKEQDFGENL